MFNECKGAPSIVVIYTGICSYSLHSSRVTHTKEASGALIATVACEKRAFPSTLPIQKQEHPRWRSGQLA